LVRRRARPFRLREPTGRRRQRVGYRQARQHDGGSLPNQSVGYGGEHLAVVARHGATADLKGTASGHGRRFTEHEIINTATHLISRIDALTIGPGANRLKLVTRLRSLTAAPTLPGPTPSCA
jgi:hypothetical protein